MKEIIIFYNAVVYYKDKWLSADLCIKDGRIFSLIDRDDLNNNSDNYIDNTFSNDFLRVIEADSFLKKGDLLFFCEHMTENEIRELRKYKIIRIDAEGKHLFPGFTDIHVHFREPGFSYKETIESGSMAAARGGFTTVCAMPNLNPVPDSLKNLEIELNLIKEQARVHVLPYASITVGEEGKELVDIKALAPYVAAFTDDGRGVQNPAIMKEAFEAAKEVNKVIVAHAEINELSGKGNVHDGIYAKLNGKERNNPLSESEAVKRDLEICKTCKGSYHVCHVSSRASVNHLKLAKEAGVDCTYETAPHYLIFNDMNLKDEGRFQMNPPIRSLLDQIELINALRNDEILCIATDHAPHSEEEKSRKLGECLNGVVGLETSFPILYTYLVQTGVITLEHLIAMMSFRSVDRFRLNEVKEPWNNLGIPRSFDIGEVADLCLYDLNEIYTVDSSEFLSKGKASPFEGMKVMGRCLLTLVSGKVAYADKSVEEAKYISDVRAEL